VTQKQENNKQTGSKTSDYTSHSNISQFMIA